MTIRELVLTARARLVAAGIEPNEAAMDAELLAREVLGWDRPRFLAHETDPPPPAFSDAFDALVARRGRHEPVSGILGRREFWGLEFEVSRDVLTPRPETEIIVEEAIARAPRGPLPASPAATSAARPSVPIRVADVGTGSGCLAVCLARELPGCTVVATDISAAALAVARRNAERHGVLDRIDFRHTSLLSAVVPPIDLLVSNPPYVRAGDIPALPAEVRDYEPHEALDGGADGLDLIRQLLRSANEVLTPGACAIVEFGLGQEDGARDAVSAAGLELLAIRSDLQGIPRTLVARKLAAAGNLAGT